MRRGAGAPSVLVAPMTSTECEGGTCRSCPGRQLHGRVLSVCLCPCHLARREGVDCPRCGHPGDAAPAGPVDPLSQVTLVDEVADALDELVRNNELEAMIGDGPPGPRRLVAKPATRRSLRKMARRKAAGMCMGCGARPPAAGARRCTECLERRREYYRSRNPKARAWRPGGPGRPPIGALR